MPGWFDIFGLDPSSPEDSAGFAESADRVHALIHKEVGVCPSVFGKSFTYVFTQREPLIAA
jgi:hypothetical protein